MEQIKAWAAVLCSAAVAAGLAGIIAPTGSMEKIYKFVVSVFFLACVLVPLFQVRNIRLPAAAEVSAGYAAGGGFDSVVKRQQAEAVKNQLRTMVESCCEKTVGVTPLSVEVEVMEESGAYAAKSIRVVLSTDDLGKKEKVAQACKNQLGLDVTVKGPGS